MTVTCSAEEVYRLLDGGKFGCVNCKETRDSKEQIVIHAAITHGIRPVKGLTDGGKP